MHDLTWKDVSDDERLQGVVANTVVNSVNSEMGKMPQTKQ